MMCLLRSRDTFPPKGPAWVEARPYVFTTGRSAKRPDHGMFSLSGVGVQEKQRYWPKWSLLGEHSTNGQLQYALDDGSLRLARADPFCR
jgi:hypothetical protein